MNTNNLKKFAQGARKKLLDQVSAKLDYVLSHDTPTLRTKSETLKRLNDELASMGRASLVDKVAYTWFNRLVALRFMDANGFQPLGINVITPVSGISPQILEEAHAGHISEELPLHIEEVMDILDGRVPSINPDNDAYRILLVASCNQLSSVFPFLFEKINDYTELLLPDDLTSSFSIVKDILNGMSDEDCQEVEIIGWLYQFYISEKKDEVFASGEKVKKEDIPAATQLFTPRWIVEYMVQNTLGKLWLQNRPNSKLRDFMPYYIESPSAQSADYLKVNSVEEITLLDQACGSGHILVYGFELFSKIYEEEGYASSEIPQLIIEKNLFGFEIDERAAQLAGFALMMKARSYHRRFFKKEVKPNILHFQDLNLAEEEIKPLFKDLGISISDALFHDLKMMKQATNFGSLIQPHINTKTLEETINSLQSKVQGADIFFRPKIENLIQTLDQLILLSNKYHCIVDNPPYMGGGNMNKEISDFVKTNYPDSKADLMACFMEAGLSGLKEKGFLGMINQETWMFKTTYKDLRRKLAGNYSIDTMIHLGTRVFKEINGDKVRSTSFTLIKSKLIDYGVYKKLTFYNDSDLKKEALLNNESKTYFFNKNLTKKITEQNWAYWLTDNGVKIIETSKPLAFFSEPKKGTTTSKDDYFLKLWYEVSFDKIEINQNYKEKIKKKWFPVNKGGGFRKWYGLLEYVINWENDGEEIKNFRDENGKIRSRPQNLKFNFQKGITWTSVSSTGLSCRYSPEGMLMTDNGATIFNSPDELITLSLLNSVVGEYFLSVLTPGFKFDVGVINKFPVKTGVFSENPVIVEKALENVNIAKLDWDSMEVSWDFHKNAILNHKCDSIEETYELYKHFWKNKFSQVYINEKELNRQFIEIYGLNEELTADVPIEEITIQKLESSIEDGHLVFHSNEVFMQLVSYFVGCMFGRYSLNKEGLILANQGETIEDYFRKIEKSAEEVSSFPDEDNIIPILDDEWFEDDIVSRFHEFLKASFGEKNFRKNLAFVEECLGKDIRKYFVKDFYKDHIQRYKKRPIYWSFSSPKGHFTVLIYMHRYTPDTLNRILNNYLREFIEKLQAHRKNLLHIEVTGTPAEQNKARKEIIKLDEMIADCRQYETDILYPLATERISIDLDDGVLVNYNKFGKAVTEVQGLNDKKTKENVKKFDWIDTSQIR
ncbi:BREX-1 system adenine-specific DNA-methyltransferase PglX [Mariniradius sediminis]|uniref:site-specific DNA-methyltransferase (adenine-specific) n=1 Tax=Mariniradius sediminis TaxID=2909237 RepID=A0ABS9BTJ1_9BACT|nr:BREX-1 system adenine-specific DNA-methyltransferase PglX [Mariniradius sediminis]MCF1751375.1 BREX-1 system adenine-specific DNA-methyltransferase PglX [Mariniradius sediminis]